MKTYPFNQARFLQSILEEEIPPFSDADKKILPEIALVGRSNVGKSSLINHLLNRKNLAKVSAQPGKTQTINYFIVDEQLILVDFPGYGYAARSQDMQQKWSQAIDHYMQNRPSLSLLVLLIDSRRLPTEEDIALFNWANYHKKPLLIIFTKSDTLSEHQKKINLEKSLHVLPAENYLHYSIKNRSSRQNMIATLNRLLA